MSILILLIFFSLFLSSSQSNSLYKLPLDLLNQNFIPKIPVYLKSVANLANQLLRAGTSIGANNAEAISAISRADYRSKSYIALKEARECLYWLDLLHRNNYIDNRQYSSLYSDCEELVKILTHRCKKLEENNVTK